MDRYQPLLVALIAIVMGWFALGILLNIRRGNAVLKWMQGGLPRLGERTTLRWLGSSAVELTIAKARAPFRRAELVLVMEPRDVPWLWLISRLQGRRDMLIVRGQLSSAPRLEYDLLAPASWTGRTALARAARAQWSSEPLGDLQIVAPKASLPVSRNSASAALESALRVHPTVWRLAVRREQPQFELHVPLPNPKKADARSLFDELCALGQRISSP